MKRHRNLMMQARGMLALAGAAFRVVDLHHSWSLLWAALLWVFASFCSLVATALMPFSPAFRAALVYGGAPPPGGGGGSLSAGGISVRHPLSFPLFVGTSPTETPD